MELSSNQTFIFFTLLVSWAFLKLRNISLIIDISSITRMSYKEVRKNMMRDLTHQSRLTYIIYVINLISIAIFAFVFGMSFASYVFLTFFWMFMVLITFGLALFMGEPSLFDSIYINIDIIYFLICTYLISGIYINALGYKKLKSVEFLNLLQQSKSKESDTIAIQDNTLTKDAKMSDTIVETDKVEEDASYDTEVLAAKGCGCLMLLFLVFISIFLMRISI